MLRNANCKNIKCVRIYLKLHAQILHFSDLQEHPLLKNQVTKYLTISDISTQQYLYQVNSNTGGWWGLEVREMVVLIFFIKRKA